MVEFIAFFTFMNVVVTCAVVVNLHKLQLNPPDVTMKDTLEVADETADVPEQELTESEIARIHREHEFDLRISKMKEELAHRLPDVPRKGTEADILMPGIHNLPHNIIADYYDDLPDVEITQ